MYTQKRQYFDDPMTLMGFQKYYKDTNKSQNRVTKTSLVGGLQTRKKVIYVKLDVY